MILVLPHYTIVVRTGILRIPPNIHSTILEFRFDGTESG